MARSLRWIVAAVAAWALGAAAMAQEPKPTPPTTPEGWRAAAVADVDALHAQLRDNSPIPFDTENARYPRWLEDGHKAARAQAETVQDAAGHFYMLAAYANGFGDPHIAVSPLAALPPASQPGFVAVGGPSSARVVWRDEADPAAPPVGAEILSCDGKAPYALAEERLFGPLLNGGLARDRVRGVTRLFLDRGVPFAPRPTRCRFKTDAGEQDVTLAWRPAPEGATPYWQAYLAAFSGASATWGVTEPAPGVFWIGVPTFSSGPDTAPKLQSLVSDISRRGDAMRRARAIVIDTRGNGGGNSAWADRVAEAIFTGRVLNRNRPSESQSAIDWRASVGNVAHWENWRAQAVREFGPLSLQQFQAGNTADNLRQRLNRTPPIWRDGPQSVAPSGGLTLKRPKGGAAPFPAQVFFLSNGSCGSSCLDFADRVLFVPGVKLVGAPTSGDGPYMEIRYETLPSGLVRMSIPQKVYRGSPRGALEAYLPDVPYEGPWDDASVRAFVMGLIGAP